MTFFYGRMLAQLKNEMLNEDSGASTHLIELLTSIRSDELEKPVSYTHLDVYKRQLINSMEGIVLTPEDHKALHKYIETKDEMTIFEYEYYYLAGQIMTFSYGRMLAQLKKEMLNEDSEVSTHYQINNPDVF